MQLEQNYNEFLKKSKIDLFLKPVHFHFFKYLSSPVIVTFRDTFIHKYIHLVMWFYKQTYNLLIHALHIHTHTHTHECICINI